ncbi:Signal peptidase complex catalytic subunit, partial [Datura stramonium]|nr:Signal peptidase complex catalytic subunit [Datura stramonium]
MAKSPNNPPLMKAVKDGGTNSRCLKPVNGILCICGPLLSHVSYVYLWNPITGEFKALPKPAIEQMGYVAVGSKDKTLGRVGAIPARIDFALEAMAGHISLPADHQQHLIFLGALFHSTEITTILANSASTRANCNIDVTIHAIMGLLSEHCNLAVIMYGTVGTKGWMNLDSPIALIQSRKNYTSKVNETHYSIHVGTQSHSSEQWSAAERHGGVGRRRDIWRKKKKKERGESPVVVVLSESMEPGFKRGREIPIVHRVIKTFDSPWSTWPQRYHIMGRAVG